MKLLKLSLLPEWCYGGAGGNRTRVQNTFTSIVQKSVLGPFGGRHCVTTTTFCYYHAWSFPTVHHSRDMVGPRPSRTAIPPIFQFLLGTLKVPSSIVPTLFVAHIFEVIFDQSRKQPILILLPHPFPQTLRSTGAGAQHGHFQPPVPIPCAVTRR